MLGSLVPPGALGLVLGEQDRLAADREVAALRPALVVLGQQQPAQVGVAAKDDPEELVGLALVELGGREELDAAIDFEAESSGAIALCRVRRAAP